MNRLLMILFPGKESDTKHVCYSGGCALFSKDFDGLCHQLWSTPPHHLNGKMAAMCNFYDTVHPTIVEADNMDVNEAIARVQGSEYIRKDTLLEWVKKELESAKMTNFDEFGSGEVITWERVFNKLNSM